MRNVLSLLVNVAVVILTVHITIYESHNTGITFFMAFTTLSNLLVALCCAIAVPFNIRSLIHRSSLPEFPHWFAIFKFAGTISVLVTMVTVCTFLNYMTGIAFQLRGSWLYLHLVTPILALLTCCLFERLGKNIGRIGWLWGIMPLVVYSLVYLALVLYVGPDNGGWNDFYGFNSIEGMWPISLTCMWVGATVLSFITWLLSGGSLLHKRTGAREGRHQK